MADYAERLAACRDKWEWMPGMVDTNGNRVAAYGEWGGIVMRWEESSNVWIHDGLEADAVPDITDPATKGCLCQQLDPIKRPVWYNDECWTLLVGCEYEYFRSEEEAILRAVEVSDG